MANNCGTDGIRASSTADALNEFLLGVVIYGAAIYLILSIEQEYGIILSHRSQYNKREGTFFQIHVTVTL